MKIIEFFGLPFSGKTHEEKNLVKLLNNNKIYNYNTIFIYYLYKEKKINFVEYFVIKKFLDRKNFKDKKILGQKINRDKNTFINNIKKKIFFNFSIKIDKEKKKYYKKNKGKYIKLQKLINIYVKNQPVNRTKKIRKWMNDQIIAYDIAKKDKSNNLMINSEGFIQRLLSLNLYLKKINIKSNYKILQSMPKADYFIYIKENNSEIIKRMSKLNYQNSIYFKKITNLNLVLKEITGYMIQKKLIMLNKKNYSNFFKKF